MKKVLVFAAGTKDGGGSGFQELVENTCPKGILNGKIVAVVSNHPNGGVWKNAGKLEIPFIHFAYPYSKEGYQKIVAFYKPNLISLSGWLKPTVGLDPKITINIHPGPLPKFGGSGMYGHHIHEAVMAAFRAGEIIHSAVSMHFVTEEYDKGPIFFRYPIKIRGDDTPETLAIRASKIEHSWQPFVTNLVLQGDISWDGKDPKSLKVPIWYKLL